MADLGHPIRSKSQNGDAPFKGKELVVLTSEIEYGCGTQNRGLVGVWGLIFKVKYRCL
jgi:hypothetical protein